MEMEKIRKEYEEIKTSYKKLNYSCRNIMNLIELYQETGILLNATLKNSNDLHFKIRELNNDIKYTIVKFLKDNYNGYISLCDILL